MFDIGAFELLVIVVVAVLVIGPKDMPLALRTAGRWIGKVRRVSAHFRSGVDAMIREAELEEMEKKWKAQNEAIMAKSGTAKEYAADEMTGPAATTADAARPASEDASCAAGATDGDADPDDTVASSSPRGSHSHDEPQLPLGRTGKEG